MNDLNLEPVVACDCGHVEHQTGEGPWTGFCSDADCDCEAPTYQLAAEVRCGACDRWIAVGARTITLPNTVTAHAVCPPPAIVSTYVAVSTGPSSLVVGLGTDEAEARAALFRAWRRLHRPVVGTPLATVEAFDNYFGIGVFGPLQPGNGASE